MTRSRPVNGWNGTRSGADVSDNSLRVWTSTSRALSSIVRRRGGPPGWATSQRELSEIRKIAADAVDGASVSRRVAERR